MSWRHGFAWQAWGPGVRWGWQWALQVPLARCQRWAARWQRRRWRRGHRWSRRARRRAWRRCATTYMLNASSPTFGARQQWHPVAGCQVSFDAGMWPDMATQRESFRGWLSSRRSGRSPACHVWLSRPYSADWLRLLQPVHSAHITCEPLIQPVQFTSPGHQRTQCPRTATLPRGPSVATSLR